MVSKLAPFVQQGTVVPLLQISLFDAKSDFFRGEVPQHAVDVLQESIALLHHLQVSPWSVLTVNIRVMESQLARSALPDIMQWLVSQTTARCRLAVQIALGVPLVIRASRTVSRDVSLFPAHATLLECLGLPSS